MHGCLDQSLPGPELRSQHYSLNTEQQLVVSTAEVEASGHILFSPLLLWHWQPALCRCLSCRVTDSPSTAGGTTLTSSDSSPELAQVPDLRSQVRLRSLSPKLADPSWCEHTAVLTTLPAPTSVHHVCRSSVLLSTASAHRQHLKPMFYGDWIAES